ncbi:STRICTOSIDINE SYNTHASE 3 [Spatholobus suberectus]|nr:STRICTOSIDINE SYNTHASE 3 [Spatholobus suberectus]
MAKGKDYNAWGKGFGEKVKDCLVFASSITFLYIYVLCLRKLAKDPTTKETTVLLRNVQFPNNISLSKDDSFFIFSEGMIGRYMNNYLNALYPKMRKVILKIPIPIRIQYMIQIGGRFHAIVVKYNPERKLLQILEGNEGKIVKAVSE